MVRHPQGQKCFGNKRMWAERKPRTVRGVRGSVNTVVHDTRARALTARRRFRLWITAARRFRLPTSLAQHNKSNSFAKSSRGRELGGLLVPLESVCSHARGSVVRAAAEYLDQASAAD